MADAPHYGPDGSMQVMDELREMLTILQRGARGLDAWGCPDPSLRDNGDGVADARKREYARQYVECLEKVRRLEMDEDEYRLRVAKTEAELRLRAEEVRTQQMAIMAQSITALAAHDPDRAFRLIEEKLPDLVLPSLVAIPQDVKLLKG